MNFSFFDFSHLEKKISKSDIRLYRILKCIQNFIVKTLQI